MSSILYLFPGVNLAFKGNQRSHRFQWGQWFGILSGAAEIRLDTQKLVVVEHQEWKERIKKRQERGEK